MITCKLCNVDFSPIQMGTYKGTTVGYADCPKCGTRKFFHFYNHEPIEIEDIRTLNVTKVI